MTTTGKLFFGTLVLLLVGGSLYYYGSVGQNPAAIPAPAQNETFTINGEPVLLVNGKFEKESVPGSSFKTTVTYFGNEVKGDFNGDGKEDRAFLVTENSGGSGTFYYLVTSLGGEAVLLGDRIAPQTTEYRNGEIIVNYADRNKNEPMVTKPSLGVSRYFKFESGNLIEIKKASPAEIKGATASTTVGTTSAK